MIICIYNVPLCRTFVKITSYVTKLSSLIKIIIYNATREQIHLVKNRLNSVRVKLKKYFACTRSPEVPYNLADLIVSKRPGTSNRIEIHFAVFSHLYFPNISHLASRGNLFQAEEAA